MVFEWRGGQERERERMRNGSGVSGACVPMSNEAGVCVCVLVRVCRRLL